MNMQDVRMLFDYHYWANERILRSASNVRPDLFDSASLGYCKLHETLVHAMSAEWNWRSRWQGVSQKAMLDPNDFPTLDAVRDRWNDEKRQMYTFLDTLSDDDLEQPVAYTTMSGKPSTNTLWHMMIQVVNHGTQHRSELAMLLTELGHSPGDIDVITFMREQQ
jgi:uncharacterized damage-inducible protein DinB